MRQCGELRREKRQAHSVWKLAYAGAVGSQTLLGIPVLERLRRKLPHLRVWPFETGLSAVAFTARAPTVVLGEIWPGILCHREIAAIENLEKEGDRVRDRTQVRALAHHFARLDASDELAPLFSPRLTAEQRHQVEAEEGWILGA